MQVLDHSFILGTAIQRLKDHKSSIFSVKWSPISEYVLASGSSDQSIKLWDVRNSKSFLTIPNAHYGTITNLQFSKDGKFLYSSGNDNKLKKWDLSDNGKDTLVLFQNIENSHLKANQFTLSNTWDL
jgi:WD40 repeat protein